METKAKILIIGLVLLLAVSLFSLFYAISSKELMRQQYEAEKQKLQSERDIQKKKADSAVADKTAAESRADELKRSLDKITMERASLQKDYEDLKSRNEEVLAELKKKREKEATTIIAAPAPSPTAAPLIDDAYWAGVLKDKAGLEIQVNAFKEQVNNLKLSIEEMKKDKANVDFEISNLNREKQDLERKLIYNERINESLSAELVREKKDKIELNKQLKEINSEYATIVRQLKNLNNAKVELENKLQQAQQDRLALQGQINDLNSKLQAQALEVGKPQQAVVKETPTSASTKESSVELPPIIVRSGEAPASKPLAFTGKVIAVNRENNFIVIDLGEEKGMRPSLTLGIYRGGNKVATVEIVQIRRLISACDIKEELSPINVGDEVR